MKIFVSRNLPGEALKALSKRHQVEISPYDRVLTREELLKSVSGIDGLLCLLTDVVDSEVMDAAGSSLKIIANYAVGFDNIDLKAATGRGIMVTNTPEVLNEAVAELTWALILSLARRVVEADEFMRKASFRGWDPGLFLGRDVYGKTLGIVGFGHIGSLVARRAKGFEMKVLYFSRSRKPEAEKELGIRYADLDKLLRGSDVVTLHLPLTPQTRHLIGQKELKKMKPTAYLVNTSRGPVVDEKALAESLREGEIAGAGLDVYENEPDVYPELLQMENVVLTPHIASATIEARSAMAQVAVDNLLAGLAGKKPPNLVNQEVWKK